MPIHDWTRVDAGLFHDFHQSWAVALRNSLNAGTLPSDYFALVEQNIRGPVPFRTIHGYLAENRAVFDEEPKTAPVRLRQADVLETARTMEVASVSAPSSRVNNRCQTTWYINADAPVRKTKR